MRITLHPVSVRELFDGYTNNAEEGVFGYGGRLNIRPCYQREFIYSAKQEAAVIDSVRIGVSRTPLMRTIVKSRSRSDR